MIWVLLCFLLVLVFLTFKISGHLRKIDINGEVNSRAILSKIDGYFVDVRKIDKEISLIRQNQFGNYETVTRIKDRVEEIYEKMASKSKGKSLNSLLDSLKDEKPRKEIKSRRNRRKSAKGKQISEQKKAWWASLTPEKRAEMKRKTLEGRQKPPKPPEVIHL